MFFASDRQKTDRRVPSFAMRVRNGRLFGVPANFTPSPSRGATRVFITNMAMCRAWLALLPFVRLHSSFQDVGLPIR